MKNHIIVIAFLPILLASCGPTRIVTYNPSPAATHYSTTISPYGTRTTTTITQVHPASEDISLQLDLQAVAALFAQAPNVEEFEMMLNNGQYPVSNLDLNRDGYIDYLRVIETVNGYNHIFIIQAVLAENVFQDVATLVAEIRGTYNYYMEIIGDPFIYGPGFIVRPRFYARPPIFEIILTHHHGPWHSPWHWDHFPPHYRHPRPIFLNHYQAYVRTYMAGHPYCHEVFYPVEPRFRDYDRYTREYRRDDYGKLHPERTFTTRNANTPNASGQGNVKNAYDIRLNNESTKTTRTTDNRAASSVTTGRGSSNGSATRSSSSANSRSATSSSSSTGTNVRSSSTGSSVSGSNTSTRSNSGSSATRSSGTSGSTVTRSRVNSSGASTTTTGPASGRSSSSSSATTRSNSGSSTRSSSGSTTRSSGSTSSTRSSSSSSSTRSSSSGTTRSSSSSSSTRSSGSTTSTSSSSTTRGNRR